MFLALLDKLMNNGDDGENNEVDPDDYNKRGGLDPTEPMDPDPSPDDDSEPKTEKPKP